MNKELKSLAKKVCDYYWKHNQTLIVDTWEVIENNERDCVFDVYLKNSDISLFTIQNYNAFNDIDFVNKSYFRDSTYKIAEKWDSVKASCVPLYYDEIITLKKFDRITKDDIVKATNYFVHEILNLWPIFNIKFKEEAENGK